MFTELTVFARSCSRPFIYVIFTPPHDNPGEEGIVSPVYQRRKRRLRETEGSLWVREGIDSFTFRLECLINVKFLLGAAANLKKCMLNQRHESKETPDGRVSAPRSTDPRSQRILREGLSVAGKRGAG